MTNQMFTKMIIYACYGLKSLWQKGENAGLITSIFSFSHKVFKKLYKQGPCVCVVKGQTK